MKILYYTRAISYCTRQRKTRKKKKIKIEGNANKFGGLNITVIIKNIFLKAKKK